MRDSQLKLKDKTIVISGPLTLVTQSLTTYLTELGANVALLTDDVNRVQKFADNVNISRESNPNIGKAISLEGHIDSKERVTEAFSRVAEFYGTIDAIVDGFILEACKDKTNSNLVASECLLQGGLPYLTGRKKGRYIILNDKAPWANEADQKHQDEISKRLGEIIKQVSSDIVGSQVTLNVINIGPTEEFLLRAYPETSSLKEALEELKKVNPKAKIVEPVETAQVVAFLASPLSAAINNQYLNINYGIEY